MSEETHPQHADVRAMLTDAARLNENGQHGAALKKGYQASDHIAATYLSKITDKSLPPDNATFELFYETIQEPERHPDLLSKIEDVIGDVYVLREAYEPALLYETSPQDAQQMINRVTAMGKLVEGIVKNP